MQNSFVHKIVQQAQMPNRNYYRGPDLSGTHYAGNLVQPETVVVDILNARRWGDDKIFLTGYSRGGAIAIAAAALLASAGIQVDALFLFDAVDRSWEIGSTAVIPDNVRYAYHAVRMDSTSSRETFDHCGLGMRGPGEFLKREFYTTHGGMGGVPWGERGFTDQVQRAANALKPCAPEISYRLPNGQVTPMPRNGPLALEAQRDRIIGAGYISEGGIDGSTKVTMAEERRGMEEVRSWMWWQLWKHGVIG